MADDIITGLDIGSSVIRLAICKSSLDEEGKPHVQLMGAIASPSSGIHRGAISSMEDAVSSISRALERAERMTGVQINSAWVALSGQNSAIQASRGAIAVARPEAEITEEFPRDLKNAMRKINAGEIKVDLRHKGIDPLVHTINRVTKQLVSAVIVALF
ncbi:hypothetical protein EBT31_02210 [bacterium]|nr:hypothetical protein [bacterium]